MVSQKRWRYAQKAEKAYQESKAERVEADMSGIIAIAEAKSEYIVTLLGQLGFKTNQNMAVVEVGSGSHGLIWKFPSTNRTAIDPLAHFYFKNFSSLQNKDVKILAAKGENIPLSDNSANLVLSENVLDHTHDPGKTLAEVNRILKPNGCFYCSVDVHGPLWVTLGRAYNIVFSLGLPLDLPAFPAHPHHFRQNEVIDLFRANDFSIFWKRLNKGKEYSASSIKEKLIQKTGKDQLLEIVARKASD